jgi:hypothetical protein
MMQAPVDLFERKRQEAAEAAVRNEQVRKANIETFTRMWLSLGVDCIRAANSSHRAELDEALGLATHKWSTLLDMESQIQRDANALAARPKKRPAAPGDDLLPERTLAERDRAVEEQTKGLHVALAELRKLAERERAELESLTQRR